jgi:hypothetical protein
MIPQPPWSDWTADNRKAQVRSRPSPLWLTVSQTVSVCLAGQPLSSLMFRFHEVQLLTFFKGTVSLSALTYVTLDSSSVSFVRCGTNWNYVLTVVTMAARNPNEVMVRVWLGYIGVCNWHKCGVSVGGFMLVRLTWIWLQSPWRLLTFHFFKNKLFLSSIAIFKDNAAINWEKCSFPLSLTRHTALVSYIVVTQQQWDV